VPQSGQPYSKRNNAEEADAPVVWMAVESGTSGGPSGETKRAASL